MFVYQEVHFLVVGVYVIPVSEKAVPDTVVKYKCFWHGKIGEFGCVLRDVNQKRKKKVCF